MINKFHIFYLLWKKYLWYWILSKQKRQPQRNRKLSVIIIFCNKIHTLVENSIRCGVKKNASYDDRVWKWNSASNLVIMSHHPWKKTAPTWRINHTHILYKNPRLVITFNYYTITNGFRLTEKSLTFLTAVTFHVFISRDVCSFQLCYFKYP